MALVARPAPDCFVSIGHFDHELISQATWDFSLYVIVKAFSSGVDFARLGDAHHEVLSACKVYNFVILIVEIDLIKALAVSVLLHNSCGGNDLVFVLSLEKHSPLFCQNGTLELATNYFLEVLAAFWLVNCS